MRVLTYDLFQQVVSGDVDKQALLKARKYENPFIAKKIDLILEETKPSDIRFNTSHFTTHFRDADTPKSRLHEVVITNLLFFSCLVQQEKFVRSIHYPGSIETMQGWDHLLRIVFYCITTLAYNLEWSPRHHFDLDNCILELAQGNVGALRDFLTRSFGVDLSAAPPRLPAEDAYDTMVYHRNHEFGPYYWRLLHFMAEAFPVRNSADSHLAKSLWRDFICESMHRTLRCPVCMMHFRSLVQETKSRIMDETEDFPRLWFQLHNRVNAITYRQPYEESDYEKDAAFMQSALVP